MENTVKDISPQVRRQAGQSLRGRRDELIDSECMPQFVLACVLVTVLVFECLHKYCKQEPMPGLIAVLLVCALLRLGWKLYSTKRKVMLIRRGEEGERIVAQAIEDGLVPAGYYAFHDIQMKKGKKRFNVDHVVIGPNGVFAIETKNYRKPPQGQAKVTYDGRTVLWSGRKCHHDAAAQAAAVAHATQDYLHMLTGKSIPVKPVLCAVGWYVESTSLFGNPVLLVMEKTLASVIRKVNASHPLDADTLQLLKAKLSCA